MGLAIISAMRRIFGRARNAYLRSDSRLSSANSSNEVPRPLLLVLASTYPRWADDPEPAFVHELCRRLASQFRVMAVVPDAPGADPSGMLDGVEVVRYRYAPRRLQTLVNDGGIVTNLRRARWKYLLVPTFVLGQYWTAWRIMREQSVSVIHAHWLLPQGLIARRLSRGFAVPYVVTSHGADLFGLRAGWLTALKRSVAASCAAMTVVSDAMRQETLRLGLKPSILSVMPMGVDLRTRFVPGASELRSDTEILFVGRLVEKKGLRHLVDAMSAIVEESPQSFLTVAGFGPEEPALREQVVRCGLQERVHFLGAIPQAQLPALYQRAALLVAPFVRAESGDQEGLGLVPIEALACGCPVIVGDVPAARDLPAERIDCGNPIVLAKAVLRILGDPAGARKEAARQRAECLKRFDWNAASVAYAELLQASKTSA